MGSPSSDFYLWRSASSLETFQLDLSDTKLKPPINLGRGERVLPLSQFLGVSCKSSISERKLTFRDRTLSSKDRKLTLEIEN